MNGHYHRSAKGGGEWEFFDLPEQWTIGYNCRFDKSREWLQPFTEAFSSVGRRREMAVSSWFARISR